MKSTRSHCLQYSSSLIAILLAFPLLAFDFSVPNTADRVDSETRDGSIALPIGMYGLVSQPRESVTGQIDRQAWSIEGSSSAYELMQQLMTTYQRDGYQPSWECATETCGGFDFRYGIEVSPPPDFLVNLNEFYYVDLRKEDSEVITILSSAQDNTIYLQQTHIRKATDDAQFSFYQQPAEAQNVSNTARWTLASVTFDSGKTTPSEYDPQELEKIKTRLEENPSETVYIVGHSDQSGGLDPNLSVTQARAEAVRQILISELDVSANRVLARGVAFLAPIADNSTEDGRAQNRRVEAVFLSN